MAILKSKTCIISLLLCFANLQGKKVLPLNKLEFQQRENVQSSFVNSVPSFCIKFSFTSWPRMPFKRREKQLVKITLERSGNLKITSKQKHSLRTWSIWVQYPVRDHRCWVKAVSSTLWIRKKWLHILPPSCIWNDTYMLPLFQEMHCMK